MALDPFKVLKIEPSKIIAMETCEVFISYDDYDDESEIVEKTDSFSIPGIFTIFFPEKQNHADIVTPYAELNLMKTNDYNETDKGIIIKYEKNDIIVDTPYAEYGGSSGNLKKILDGKINYIKTPEAFVTLFHNNLQVIDLVHIELMISNMLYDENTNELCRLTGNFKNFKQIGVMENAKNNSWLSAIAFQNIEQGIHKGLVSGKDAKLNPIENVIIEAFDDL